MKVNPSPVVGIRRLGVLIPLLVIQLLFFPLSLQASGKERAVVVRVIDGDSLEVVQGNTTFQARLWGIDSPEYLQQSGDEARVRLQRMVEGRTILFDRKYTDRYRRAVVMIWVDGLLVNEKLVSEGLAWVHGRYCNQEVCETWHKLEKAARRSRSGLWREDDPVPPWQWKKQRGRGNSRLD